MTMRVRLFDDPRAFQAHVTPLLAEREAENCVTLGMLSRATQSPPSEPDRRGELVLMCAVEDAAGRPVAVATMNRPYVILVTRAGPEAVEALAGALLDRHIELPGVQAPGDTAAAFADAWTRRTGLARRPALGLGLYQTSSVVPPRPVAGTFRPAVDADLDLLASWGDAFVAEAGMEPGDMRQHMSVATREQRVFVWCDPPDQPVSMALWTGRTPNGARVGMVYTPPRHRARGYASNCVATLTRLLLESGLKFVFLFTDLANPTSNGIYRAIGYRHLCDVNKILFATPVAQP
jgi:predicted GNAT family acetyltransferase